MGALDGVRVIEPGQLIAGTYGTQYLADYRHITTRTAASLMARC
jgi:hypothetical protein